MSEESGRPSTPHPLPPLDVTALLVDWSKGDQHALDDLMEAVYFELRRIASTYLRRERPEHTLQTTGLVNEAYLRLIDQTRVSWNDRLHFFSVAAEMMRRILIDYARSRAVLKRGGNVAKIPLEKLGEIALDRPEELIALDDALTELHRFDEQLSQVVELRFFGGFKLEEIAELVGCSRATISRRWRVAKAWLHRNLSNDASLQLEENS